MHGGGGEVEATVGITSPAMENRRAGGGPWRHGCCRDKFASDLAEFLATRFQLSDTTVSQITGSVKLTMSFPPLAFPSKRPWAHDPISPFSVL